MRHIRSVLLLVALGAVAWWLQQNAALWIEQNTATSSAIDELFHSRTSGVMVETHGTVQRLLADDLDGSRHQRFILQIPSRLTLLVAHNIDLAPRVDGIAIGDVVSLRGQYEWNDKGGVVHWTHHDPEGRHDPGWIEHRGRRYE